MNQHSHSVSGLKGSGLRSPKLICYGSDVEVLGLVALFMGKN